MLGGRGGVPGPPSVRLYFCWGRGGEGQQKVHPCFLVPKGNQPTACTLALWWLRFGPTGLEGGGGGGGLKGGGLAGTPLPLWSPYGPC